MFSCRAGRMAQCPSALESMAVSSTLGSSSHLPRQTLRFGEKNGPALHFVLSFGVSQTPGSPYMPHCQAGTVQPAAALVSQEAGCPWAGLHAWRCPEGLQAQPSQAQRGKWDPGHRRRCWAGFQLLLTPASVLIVE